MRFSQSKIHYWILSLSVFTNIGLFCNLFPFPIVIYVNQITLEMRSIIILLTIMGLLLSPKNSYSQKLQAGSTLKSIMKTITSETGDSIQVESGRLNVPENRKNNKGRTISIEYYRINSQSTNARKTPIFVLAGGPGSSYINALHKEKYFSEIMFLKEHSDVIIFDQRGAGNSIPNLTCKGRHVISIKDELTEANLKNAFVTRAMECQNFWLDQGVELSAYNTDESASDINDLRIALGYDKIILSGGSYGSHLGLHTIRKFPNMVEKAIFYGIEGPDHTWDRPIYLLNTLKRIAHNIETLSPLKEKIPEGGLMKILEELINRFDAKSQTVTLTKGNQTLDAIVNKMIIQRVATYKAGSRNDPLQWANLLLDMYNENYIFPAKASVGMHRISAPNAMKYAMDFSSGISEYRKELILHDKAQEIVGNINFDYQVQEGIWNVDDLGDAFRENIITDIPVLLVHGNWDTSTPIENAREVLPGLKNGYLIEVEKGTHNVLYECYRYVNNFKALISDFIKGEFSQLPKTLELPEIEYPSLVSEAQKQLWDSCIEGNLKDVIAAVENGADINQLDLRKSKSGRRPLNWAAYYGHKNIVMWLVDNKADINGQNKTGFTALHHAVEKNNIEIVELLIEYGADKNIKNKRGLKPIDLAITNKFTEILKLLKN